ncbi:MAG: penicillin-binding transpeptidase domain-containing protein, partial [Candidatus Binatia bacterium]
QRKVTELFMAVLLELHYDKDEILETYLNEIYLGQRGPKGIYGVWEGARFYFGKDPRDLSIAESAMLAGLIKAPGIYSPTRNPARAVRRRSEVLRALRARGEIGADEYEEALREPLPDRLPTVEGSEAPYFVDFVRSELEGRHAEDALTSQGYRIFTSLDAVLQRAAEAAVRRGLAELEKRHPRLVRQGEEPVQAALLAVEPHTGEIRAMVGGRAYQTSQFNRVTQARRQPGSIFKPIVFLAAFEEEERRAAREYLPTRRLQDEPFVWRYDAVAWEPKNYRGLYHGEVSLRDALELSLNSATARLAAELGIDRVREMAIRLGFSERLPPLPSLVLGSVEVTPFAVAQAFSAIANLGFRPEVASIRTVLDGEGQALVRNPMRAEQVVSPRVAYLVTNLMEGVVDRGTARAVRAAGVDVPLAGKTGTTNEGRDAWFVGFTSDLLAVVWVGFDRESPLGLSGAEAALPIWIEFMKSVIRGHPPAPFLVPPGIQKAAIDPASGQLATARCPETLEESFLEGGAPIDFCRLHPGPGLEAAALQATPSPPLLVPPAPPAAPIPRASWWFLE